MDPLIVANDLVRVFLEAVFDSFHGLPVVSSATAKELGHCVNDPERATSAASVHLSEENFAEVENWVNRGEAVTTALVGSAVRGAGWIALNNESLAGLLETMVGVLVRKTTEKAAWCVYSCRGGGDQESSFDSSVELRIVVPGPPPAFPSAD